MVRVEFVYVTLVEYDESSYDATLLIECSNIPLEKEAMEHWVIGLQNGMIHVFAVNFKAYAEENRLTINQNILEDYEKRGEIGQAPKRKRRTPRRLTGGFPN